MFPSEEDVTAAYEAVRARFGLDARVSGPAIRSALRDAEQLAEDVFEGPAAVLYAFARVPRAFAGYRTMTVLLALDQVACSGQTLTAPIPELAELCERVTRSECDYEGVRAFFADRLLPFGG